MKNNYSKYFSGFLKFLLIKRKPVDNVKMYCLRMHLIILVSNFQPGVPELGRWFHQCLLYLHEDLGSDSQNSHKGPHMAVSVCDTSVVESETGRSL